MTAGSEKKNQRFTSRNGFRLEAERNGGGITLVACPVIGIEDLSDCEVRLKTHSGRISVLGKRLSVGLLEGGAVEISGKVENINFGYGKN